MLNRCRIYICSLLCVEALLVFTNASSGSKVSYFSTKRHTACVRPARRVPATAAYSKWRCYGFVQSALWFQVTLGAMGEEVVPARGLAVSSFTGMRAREVCCKRSRRSNFFSLKAALVSYRANFAELTRGKSDLRSSESSQCDLTPELALLSRSVGPADGAPR